ncbi:DUF3618 domain-containing protein [Kitasatospora paracochleata]|uniref:DUF3618 domain-containing protein n=1 Tax=Kitasatospora paracochleata TaxID=58354 RepID=A0ABT1IYC1_9ACTN|nr:DUF3618 domain-containing protein [Kitasatospora paracochleata]MCP2310155.1 hypothetical protein [Kitasatospora paracochleata]
MASTKDQSTRTTAQIEADIVQARDRLASNLDELAMRVHPASVAAQARARLMASVEQKAGRAYVAASGAMERVTAGFRDEKGQPRPERIVPVALVGVGVVLLIASARRRHKD